MGIVEAGDRPSKAKVTSVIPTGKHGPYAVAVLETQGLFGSITFSLGQDVWKEGKEPSPGDFVALEDIRERRGGWRSGKARFWRPSDDQQ